MTGCFEFMEDLEDNKIDANMLLAYFKEVYMEPIERGMLEFSFKSESDRELAEQIWLGIEKSQHIQIGDLNGIMAVRG